MEEVEGQSSDQEENARKRDEHKLKIMIKNRVKLYFSVQELVKKLRHIHCTLFDSKPSKEIELLKTSEINQLYSTISLLHQYLEIISSETE